MTVHVKLEHPQTCTQCGTCVSVCPVELVGGHAIVTFLADPAAVDYSVWLCTSCWRCNEACPSGVDIHGLMMAARRREPAPVWYLDSFERIKSSTLALRITQRELDAIRAGWELEDVELAPAGRVKWLLLSVD